MATEFKSQICTTVEQSKRLLGLGLKKETADMTWKFSYLMKGVPQYDCLAESTWDSETIARYVQHCGLMNLTEHWKHSDGTQMSSEDVYAEITKKDIPAWSLHRLLCMIPNILRAEKPFENSFSSLMNIRISTLGIAYYYEDYDENRIYEFECFENLMEASVSAIEWLIKEGYFNKEYLEE